MMAELINRTPRVRRIAPLGYAISYPRGALLLGKHILPFLNTESTILNTNIPLKSNQIPFNYKSRTFYLQLHNV